MKFKNDEWKRVKIEDLGEVIGGGTPSTKVDEFYGGNIPWITPKDLSGYTKKYIFAGERNITDKGLKNSSAKLLPKGTVLFSSRAPIGYIAIAGQEVSTNQGFKSVIPDEEVTSSEFLYYLLKYNTEKIINRSSGSTFKEISGKSMKNVEVVIPNKKTQSKISNILSAFDQKIEVNNKIIANLEEQAQAIFKSWFVDFEPFQDGEFVESELGLIPLGFQVVELNDITEFDNGYGFKGKDLLDERIEEDDYRVFKMADIKVGGGINTGRTKSWISKEFVKYNRLEAFLIKRGDLLMCMTDMKDNVRLLGHTALMNVDDEYILNQRVGRIRISDKRVSPGFIYYLTNNNKFLENLRGRANRGVQVNLSTKEIKASKLLLPKEEYLKLFNNIAEKSMDLIFNLQIQNEKLAQTRDALLPKLMSGEIDVNNINIDAEEECHG